MSLSNNQEDQNSVFIISLILMGGVLIIKMAFFLPMIFFGLLWGLLLYGSLNLKGEKRTAFLMLFFFPFFTGILFLGFPTEKHIYWGVFDTKIGLEFFKQFSLTYNLLINRIHLKWLKKYFLIQSLYTYDIQLYFLKTSLFALLSPIGFFLFDQTFKNNRGEKFSSLSLKLFEQLQSLILLYFRKHLPYFSPLILFLLIFFIQFNHFSPFLLFPLFLLLFSLILKAISRLKTTSSSKDLILIGKSLSSSSNVYLTKANLNYHVQIIGGSGSGKTTFIQVILKQLIPQKMGIIFVDLKADSETIEWIKKEANHSNRENDLEFFSLTQHHLSKSYNPIKHGTAPEILSQIMTSLEWTEEFYKKTSSQALSDLLLALCEIRDQTGHYFTLSDLARYLSDPEEIETLAVHSCLNEKNKDTLRKRAQILREKEGQKNISGLLSDLVNITRSSAGPLIGQYSLSDQAIDIKNTIHQAKISYFLLNSMADKASSIQIGKLILQDIIRSIGEIYDQTPENKRTSCLLIIDEFASFATDNFIDLLNRARGAKLGIMVAHQSRGDLKKVSPTFSDQLERNCNTKIIFGTDNPEDAEYFASMVGTQSNDKHTMRYQSGILGDQFTGEKSVRQSEEFIIHPNQIKKLKQGQILKISRIVDQESVLTQLSTCSPTRPEQKNLYINDFIKLKLINDWLHTIFFLYFFILTKV